jgi:hypothetical protein
MPADALGSDTAGAYGTCAAALMAVLTSLYLGVNCAPAALQKYMLSKPDTGMRLEETIASARQARRVPTSPVPAPDVSPVPSFQEDADSPPIGVLSAIEIRNDGETNSERTPARRQADTKRQAVASVHRRPMSHGSSYPAYDRHAPR